MALPHLQNYIQERIMTLPRQVLADNLRRLMAADINLSSQSKVLRRANGLSNGTLDRIRRATVSCGVDELQKLAEVFNVEPWELLKPKE